MTQLPVDFSRNAEFLPLPYEDEGIPTPSDPPASPSSADLGLFALDCPKAGAEPPVSIDGASPSWWNQLRAWLRPAQVDTPPMGGGESSRPISRIPLLEAPAEMPKECPSLCFSATDSSRSGRKTRWSHSEVMEGLSKMSRPTLEQIVRIIRIAQIELEKEGAAALEGTFSKYQEFQKSQRHSLEAIKEALAKDERLAAYFGSAKNLTVAASFVFSIAALVASSGFLAAPAASAVSAGGASVSAVLAGLTGGANAYFKRRSHEDEAQHEESSHSRHNCRLRIEDVQNHLLEKGERTHTYEEKMIQRIRSQRKLASLVWTRH